MTLYVLSINTGLISNSDSIENKKKKSSPSLTYAFFVQLPPPFFCSNENLPQQEPCHRLTQRCHCVTLSYSGTNESCAQPLLSRLNLRRTKSPAADGRLPVSGLCDSSSS